MATLRDIRRRIRAIQNTQQITRAMYMVAATKLRRAEEQARAGRPYSARLRQLIARMAEAAVGFQHPLLERRPVERTLVVLITADRGLAGPYNTNLIRKAEQVITSLEGTEIQLLPVGRKGRDHFVRRGFVPPFEVPPLGDNISYTDSRQLARRLAAEFEAKRVDEVRIVYSQYISAVTQRPVEEVLLPITDMGEGKRGQDDAGAPGGEREYILEPSPERILAELLPRYVETEVYRSLVEAKASEHGARMTAMKNATDNAGELVEVLTLDLNRARQAAITKEIAEIVGGAEALSG